ncbi:circularly permuted type 2 ATP-grasp protein [Rhizobium alvei]|uniref:Circularly permuted type 2 ATP-grasp protein n=1 Tax=Rhizobium alvei TaxID=1132659 RepID=A0ABT8YL85_9HYPH|nr:circularly permuted type 2 ATP-grasp protein [Rhizobium alvei]MDO6964349.1 circularly permuted type 2 ATP-grasp protein [Rhizobium alvei]
MLLALIQTLGSNAGITLGNEHLAFDEMIDADGNPRGPYKQYFEWFKEQNPAYLEAKARDAENIFRKTGITFAVYGHEDATEKLIPFDLIPRIISGSEWRKLAQGIEQRVLALNAFLEDIYHKQEIIRAGRIPRELIEKNLAFLPQMIGMKPPGGVYTHIIGTDIVRTGEDQFYVLEDNARTPSGVSYMLEDRETMMQMFPELFYKVRVRPVEDYPSKLRQSLDRLAPPGCKGKPRVVVLTPGIFNSAYYEHAFLADQMGAELVEGSDLRVINGKVCMRTTQGYEPVDVIYRRVDDDFLDPLTFRPDSCLGVAGIMDVYRAGNVTIANAPGTGISDDKAIYSYMPEIVEFYTGRKAMLENVPTWRCSEPDSFKYVMEHLPELVVKEVHGSGGYGMLVGPTASRKEIALFAEKLKAKPANYIAQPTLSLSTVPIMVKKGIAPRHVDLRPYVLVSDKVHIIPGGLTRVALKKGSLVVNSSQGGGTKDTWVLED